MYKDYLYVVMTYKMTYKEPLYNVITTVLATGSMMNKYSVGEKAQYVPQNCCHQHKLTYLQPSAQGTIPLITLVPVILIFVILALTICWNRQPEKVNANPRK